jgi:predicted MFS family arabinose efflux permease
LTAFLTVVDLFATQAILPLLVYGVSPAAMGVAVNASTIGMAIGGLAVALFSCRINRRLGTLFSLALLSIPTALLAVAPDLQAFTALRIVQGLFMSSAFTLTLAYLAEETSGEETATAFAAYITGNVASNLFGRLMSASIADMLGLAANFYVFAVLNLAGALLVYFSLNRMTHLGTERSARSSPFEVWAKHMRNKPLRATFGIGFCILFAFIGTFTYVNFVLVRPPLGLGMMTPPCSLCACASRPECPLQRLQMSSGALIRRINLEVYARSAMSSSPFANNSSRAVAEASLR